MDLSILHFSTRAGHLLLTCVPFPSQYLNLVLMEKLQHASLETVSSMLCPVDMTEWKRSKEKVTHEAAVKKCEGACSQIND